MYITATGESAGYCSVSQCVAVCRSVLQCNMTATEEGAVRDAGWVI